jgi:hypothetical protein
MEQGKDAQHLCIGRVLEDFDGGEAGDLQLEQGEVVRVLRQVEKYWYYGHLAGDATQSGLFPARNVEIVQGSVRLPLARVVHRDSSLRRIGIDVDMLLQSAKAKSPASNSNETAHSSVGVAAGHNAVNGIQEAPTKSSSRPVSTMLNHLTTTVHDAADDHEHVESVTVPTAERKLTMDGELHSFYVIEMVTDVRKIRVEKRYSELRTADMQLRAVFPHRFTHTPRGTAAMAQSDSNLGYEAGELPETSVDPLRAHVAANLHDARLMTLKRSSATMEARRSAMEEYLQSCVRGDEMAALVLAFLLTPSVQPAVKDSDSGSAVPQHAQSGPAMKVSLSALPPPPPHPTIEAGSSNSGSGSATPLGSGRTSPAPAEATEVEPLVVELDHKPVGADAFVPGTPKPFELQSLDAFDALIEDGFAVIKPDDECVTADMANAARQNGKILPRIGQRVRIKYAALVWDGSAATASRYERVRLASFNIGDHRDNRVPSGLHQALQRMHVGQQCTILLSSEKAYGEAGREPLIPPNAQLVYDTVLEEVTGEARSMSKYTGVAAAKRRMIGGEGTAVDDEMLAAAHLIAGNPPPPTKYPGRNTRPAPGKPMAPPSTSQAGASSPGVGFRSKVAAGGAMPTPEEAEKAFKAYLASMESQGSAGSPANSKQHQRSGSTMETGSGSMSSGLRRVFGGKDSGSHGRHSTVAGLATSPQSGAGGAPANITASKPDGKDSAASPGITKWFKRGSSGA